MSLNVNVIYHLGGSYSDERINVFIFFSYRYIIDINNDNYIRVFKISKM